MSHRSRARVAVVAAVASAALGLLVPAASAEDIIECTHATVDPKGTHASCEVNPPVPGVSLPLGD